MIHPTEGGSIYGVGARTSRSYQGGGANLKANAIGRLVQCKDTSTGSVG